MSRNHTQVPQSRAGKARAIQFFCAILIFIAAGRLDAADWTFTFTYSQVRSAINAQATAGNDLANVGEYEFFARPTGLTSYSLVSTSNTIPTGATEWSSDISSHPITFSDSYAYAHWVDRTGAGYNTIAMVTDNANVVGRVYSGGFANGQTGALVPSTATWTVTIASTDPSLYAGATVSFNWYASGIQVNPDGTKIKYVAETPYTISGTIPGVPEPATWGILLFGLGAVLVARARNLSARRYAGVAMKCALVGVVAGAAFATGTSGPSPSCPSCAAGINLPTTPVNATTSFVSPNSFFQITLSGVGPGFYVTNTTYKGWCADDENAPVVLSTPVTLYSTYAALPVTSQSPNWPKVNYILNHKLGTPDEIQAAIWKVLNGSTDYPVTANVNTMVNGANAHPAFQPTTGQVLGVLLRKDGFAQKGGPLQDTLIEVPAPTCKCPLSQGYWKTHSSAWPVNSLTLGTQTYTKAELLAIMNTPVRGDSSISLAYQLIAAKLNVLSGAVVPTAVSSAIASGDALFSLYSGKLPYRVSPTSPNGVLMNNAASTLDSYNTGKLTCGCGSTSSTGCNSDDDKGKGGGRDRDTVFTGGSGGGGDHHDDDDCDDDRGGDRHR